MPVHQPNEHPNARLVRHPLLEHMVTSVRDRNTPPDRFRRQVSRIGMLLAYEATADLPTDEVRVQTPLELTTGRRLRPPITIVPILRAGLGLAEGILNLIPNAQMGHLGMARDEEALVPVSYYEKLPRNLAGGPVLLLDPMLATGGSATAAMKAIKARYLHEGKDPSIRMVCLLAAPEGLAACREKHPDVPIYTAAIDRMLNDRGYILPGLGDAGDRIFATG